MRFWTELREPSGRQLWSLSDRCDDETLAAPGERPGSRSLLLSHPKAEDTCRGWQTETLQWTWE